MIEENMARAIETGDLAMVSSLIDNNAIDINTFLPRLENPPALVFAIQENQQSIVKLLLERNADIDLADDVGRTACHIATKNSTYQLGLLELLLKHRPNLGLKDANGHSVLEIAFMECDESVWLMLINAGAPLKDILDSSYLCRFAATSTDAIEALLDRGVVVRDLVDASGGTPLHQVPYYCTDVSAFDMLVNVCGVDLEARDCNGCTCIYEAVQSSDNEVLCWLIQSGADIFSVSDYGSTLLHNVRNYECAITLLAAGACAIIGYKCDHDTPLFCAVKRRDYSVVNALLGGGADPDTIELKYTTREYLSRQGMPIDKKEVEQARRDIAKQRLDFVRFRALEVCIGLQSLELPALLTCEILLFACGPVAPFVSFHHWWKISTIVKHFKNE